MDFHNMKRKELQALCKKHSIPANLTNLEMANKLASLLKEKEKPMARGKSCFKSTVEQASENLLDDVNGQSKKVRFSPENETIEFFRSETKNEEIERGMRARRRSMLKQAAKYGGVVSRKNVDNINCSEAIVNNPVRVIKSSAVETVVVCAGIETKSEKTRLRSVALESVPVVETRVSTRRSSESKEVEKKKEELKDDTLLGKNQTKRISRKRGIKIDEKVSELEMASRKKTGEVNDDVVLNKIESEKTQSSRLGKFSHLIIGNKGFSKDEGIIETEKMARRSKRNLKQNEDYAKLNNDLGEVGVVGKRTTKRQRTQLTEDANVIETILKTGTELEVVLQIEEPSMCSSRIGNRSQSIIQQTEKTINDGSKDKTEKNALVQTTASEDKARPNRSSRRKSIAVSDAILAGLDIDNKLKNRRKIPVFEEEGAVIEDSSLVEEPPRRSRRDIKGENENDNSKSSAVEENAKSRISSSRRKSIVASNTTLAQNVKKLKPKGTRMDPVLEEENAVADGSPLVEKHPSISMQNSAEALKAFVTVGSGEAVKRKTISCSSEGIHVESLNSSDEENREVIAISGFEIVLNSGPEEEIYKDNLSQDCVISEDLALLESEVEPDIVEVVASPKGSRREEENVVIEGFSLVEERPRVSTRSAAKAQKALVTIGTGESINRKRFASRSKELHAQTSNDGDEKIRDIIDISGFEIVLTIDTEAEVGNDKLSQDCSANVDNFDSDNLVLSKPDMDSDTVMDVDSPEAPLRVEQEYSRIDLLDSIAKPAENLELENELGIIEKNESEIQDCQDFQGFDEDSGFRIVLDIDSQTEVNEDHLLQASKTYDATIPINFVLLETEPMEKGVICPDATPEDEGHPQIDQSDCADENLKLELEMDKNIESGSTKSSSLTPHDGIYVECSYGSEEKHIVEPEVVLDNSYQEKNTDSEVKGIEGLGVEGSALVSDRLEFSIGKDQASVESEVDEEIEHNIQGYLPQHAGIYSTKVVFKFASEETKDSRGHVSVRKESTPNEMEEIVETKEVEELADKIVAEGYLSPNNGSAHKEKVEIVTVEEVDSRSLDSSEQKKITAFEVEVPAAADPTMLEHDFSGSIESPFGTIRNNNSSLKKQKHSIMPAIPLSESNEIKSLMMVNLDRNPASELGKVHTDLTLQEDHVSPSFPTVDLVKDMSKATNESTDGANRNLPPHDEYKDNPNSSLTLFEDCGMEKPESNVFVENLRASQKIYNSVGQNRKHSFEDDCSTKEIEDTENEIHAEVNTLTEENETQPYEPASLQLTSGLTEHQGNGSINVGVPPTELRLLFDDEGDGNNLATEKGNSRKAVTKQEALGPTDKDEDTQVIGSSNIGNDGFADTHCIQTEVASCDITCSASASKSIPRANLLEGKKQGRSGNGSSNIEASPSELRLLFDKAQEDGIRFSRSSGALPSPDSGFESKDDDTSNEGLFPGKNFATLDEYIKKSATKKELLCPIESKDVDTEVIRSGENGFTNTTCLETQSSPSSLACNTSAFKSNHTINLPKEENEGICEMVSEHRHDDTTKLTNSPGASDNLADENALENASSSVGIVDFADKNSEDNQVEGGDLIPKIHELAAVRSHGVAMELDESNPIASDQLTNEERNEDLVKASDELEGVESQFYNGMFDNLDDNAMEMVQEFFHTEKDDSRCYLDQFSVHDKALMDEDGATSTDNSLEGDEMKIKEIAAKNIENVVINKTLEFNEWGGSSQKLTERADGVDESHSRTRNSNYMVHCLDEPKEYTENQSFSQATQWWSSDPATGFEYWQATPLSSMFSSWELNLSSKHEAAKSTSVAFKFPFTEEDEQDFLLNKQLVERCHSLEEQGDTGVVPQDSSLEGNKIPKGIDKGKVFNDISEEEKDIIPSWDVAVAEGSNLQGTGDDIFVAEKDSIVSGSKETETMVKTIKPCDAAIVSELEDRPSESAERVVGVIATDDPVIETYPLDKSKELDSSRTTLDDVGAGFRENRFGSESNVCEGEREMKKLDMFDDQSISDLSLFPNTVVSEQVTREITPNENSQREFSEDVVTETENTVVKQQSFHDIVLCTDNLGEHTEFQSISQDCKSDIKEGSATEDNEKKMELVNVETSFGIGELSVFETNSTIVKIEKQSSSLIQGTPKKPATAFDMKENATNAKRENLGSMTAKSTTKRRALVELHK